MEMHSELCDENSTSGASTPFATDVLECMSLDCNSKFYSTAVGCNPISRLCPLCNTALLKDLGGKFVSSL